MIGMAPAQQPLGSLAPPPVAASAGGLPDRPTNYSFTADYAGLIQPAELNRIGAAQREAFERSGVPIIVLTVPSMRAYSFNGPIEKFAQTMFDKWRIGSKDLPGGANNGILFLVSVGDRKARIELGGDWGMNWNSQTDRIMAQVIVPRFKSGDYTGGIAAGVEALRDLARKGPQARPQVPGGPPRQSVPGATPRTTTTEPPAGGLVDTIRDRSANGFATADQFVNSPASPVPAGTGWFFIGGGLLLMIFSAFAPPSLQKPLFWLGLILLLLPLFIFVIMFALAWLKGGQRRGGGRNWSGGWSGGSYSSGGGFSGGSSGGGGSTGSW